MHKYIAAVLLLLPLSAIAYDEEEAAVNLSHEMAICSSYLYMVSESVKEKDAELAEQYNQFSVNVFSMSVKLSNEKVAQARMKAAFDEMLVEMDYDRSNISILINQYQAFCSELSSDPEKRFQYWLDKKD